MTDKQRAWIDYYKQGKSATEAARLAGYKAGSDKAFQNIGSENLGKLGAYVIDRDKVMEQTRIADMQEINEFWTSIIRGEKYDIKDRIKASELRAKVMGAFLDRHVGNTEEGQAGVLVLPAVGASSDDGMSR